MFLSVNGAGLYEEPKRAFSDQNRLPYLRMAPSPLLFYSALKTDL